MEKIRVLVADDHPLFREGLCLFLSQEKDLEVVAQTRDGEETVKVANSKLPDVAIIDAIMPHLSGIEAARLIKVSCPNIHILIISGYHYDSYLFSALRAGASGYLLKTLPVSHIIAAVRLVNNGQVVFGISGIANIPNYPVGKEGKSDHDTTQLHPRELEILKLLSNGYSNRKIADHLLISERTVQSHMSNIFRKFEVTSRTEAVIHALRKGDLILEDLP